MPFREHGLRLPFGDWGRASIQGGGIRRRGKVASNSPSGMSDRRNSPIGKGLVGRPPSGLVVGPSFPSGAEGGFRFPSGLVVGPSFPSGAGQVGRLPSGPADSPNSPSGRARGETVPEWQGGNTQLPEWQGAGFKVPEWQGGQTDLPDWAGDTDLPDWDPSSVDLEADPGYQFRLSEGEKAIRRHASAGSGAATGATYKALQRYSQGLASRGVRGGARSCGRGLPDGPSERHG